MNLTMIRRVSFFCVFALSPLLARANLGDTIAEAVAHYGHPTGYAEASDKMPFGTILFRAGGYELVLFILDGKEVGARVSKLDKSPFTESEIKTIMDAETGSGPWTPTASGDSSTLAWSRSDHSTVLYDKNKQLLMLTTQAMAEALKGTAAGGK
jgi:hypothetical protein